jgi:hypothetical protein
MIDLGVLDGFRFDAEWFQCILPPEQHCIQDVARLFYFDRSKKILREGRVGERLQMPLSWVKTESFYGEQYRTEGLLILGDDGQDLSGSGLKCRIHS